MERFWNKVNKDGPNGCWEWTACKKTGTGYGLFFWYVDGKRFGTNAHRVSYELLVGPIADGLQIDHLCRNTSCVNPAHLEAVTPRVNVLRSTSFAAENAQKTQCPKGHEFDMVVASTGERACRTCRNATKAASFRRTHGLPESAARGPRVPLTAEQIETVRGLLAQRLSVRKITEATGLSAWKVENVKYGRGKLG